MIDRSQIKKILVFTLSNIGDVILTTTVVSLLRDRFPEAHLSVLAGPRGIPLFENCNTVDDVLIYDKKDFWLNRLKLVFKLRQARYDCVIDLRNSFLAWMIGARYKTSIWMDRSDRLMRVQHLKRISFLIPNPGAENKFHFFSPAEQSSAFEKFKGYLSSPASSSFAILAPGAGTHLKRWTVSGFAQLADHLTASGVSVALVGGQGEAAIGQDLERNISKPVSNLIGQLTLRELAGLTSRAALVVANDSSVMHLAHELDRPTVSIYGPTDEKKIDLAHPNRRGVRLHLDCTPCEVAQCRLERRVCLDDLPASLVIQACEELLNHAADPAFRH
ncbi:MAG: glycosyltransferase family 9 protein [Candidatus Omnitrophica bacterium]|nr:glycosyltransferase family 9 protein [Candidatus Omnitrophota bacterium]